MPDVHQPVTGLTHDRINPKTGRPLSLADEEVKRELKAELAQMKRQPALAEQLLKEMGILTPRGRLTKRYGG